MAKKEQQVIPIDEPNVTNGFPYFTPEVYETSQGVPYFKEAGVAMISKPNVNLNAAFGFIDGFDEELGFKAYLDDPDQIEPGDQIVKYAGQNCYLSFSDKRTWNKDAGKYLDHVKSLGHGSVAEHANYGFQFWGVDRATTHELVRHRMLSFSQTSQRYCDGKTLRFVEAPAYQPERLPKDANRELRSTVEWLHNGFEAIVNIAAVRHDVLVENLADARDIGHPLLQGGSGTEKRKRINQVARESLPNCTEAPIVVTGNARAWRGFVDQRATASADVPIRELAIKVLRCLQWVSPLMFSDYVITRLDDGTEAAKTKWAKI